MSTRTRLIAVTALTALATGAFVLPAAAADRPPIPEPADDDARAALCERIPAAQDRIAARIAAIESGEDTPGSLDRLRARIDRAEGKGRATQARMLEHRAEHRAEHWTERRVDRVEHLKENLERLADAEAAYCSAS